MSTKNTSRFMPLIIAISVVAGILIGTFYARHFAGNKLGIINSSSNKLNALLRVINFPARGIGIRSVEGVQERAREVRRRFQGDGTAYTPYTVNFYGN